LQRDIFTSLALGATLCIPAPERIGNPGWLAEWMRQEEITVAHLTPAMAQLLTQTTTGEAQIPSLRYAFTVGDVLTRRDVSRLRELAPTVTCVNLYGSTETQRAVGYFVVPDGGDSGSREVIPLGRGIQDVQLLILSPAQELAGIGELGEIHVRSPHLARGYLDDDTLTRERFIGNPFTNEPGDRLYGTGDLGRYLPDGNVVFQGRVDQQIKIRGFRIELGEIEAVLARHPGVRETVVLASTAREDKQLVAYVVLDQAAAPTPQEMRQFLGEKLPQYMVPAAFVVLDAFPLTPNGKIDRRALPAPDRDQIERESVYVAPSTPYEEILVEAWEEVLELEEIGVRDNFFSLGGHSLLATQIVSRVRDYFEIELPVRVIFEAPTVAGMALYVEQALIAEIKAQSQ
jgi:acyl-coenzyme A synthetase/AMP-(fatty) acid ligase/acyl carrier protein